MERLRRPRSSVTAAPAPAAGTRASRSTSRCRRTTAARASPRSGTRPTAPTRAASRPALQPAFASHVDDDREVPRLGRRGQRRVRRQPPGPGRHDRASRCAVARLLRPHRRVRVGRHRLVPAGRRHRRVHRDGERLPTRSPASPPTRSRRPLGGWSRSFAGNAATYTHAAAPTDPAEPNHVTATNGAGLVSAAAAFTVSPDSTAPSVTAPTVAGGFVTSTSVTVTLNGGSDGESGVAPGSSVVERQEAPLDNGDGSCDAFGGWTTVTLSGGVDTTVAHGTCYRYRELLTDRVGNQGTSAASATVKVDTTAPAAPSLVFSGDRHAESGGTIWYRPLAAARSFTVTATVTGRGVRHRHARLPGRGERVEQPRPGNAAPTTTPARRRPGRAERRHGHERGRPRLGAGSSPSRRTRAHRAGSPQRLTGGYYTLDLDRGHARQRLGHRLGASTPRSDRRARRSSARQRRRHLRRLPGLLDDGHADAGNDTTVVSGKCYRYRYLLSDRVGNEATSGAERDRQGRHLGAGHPHSLVRLAAGGIRHRLDRLLPPERGQRPVRRHRSLERRPVRRRLLRVPRHRLGLERLRLGRHAHLQPHRLADRSGRAERRHRAERRSPRLRDGRLHGHPRRERADELDPLRRRRLPGLEPSFRLRHALFERHRLGPQRDSLHDRRLQPHADDRHRVHRRLLGLRDHRGPLRRLRPRRQRRDRPVRDDPVRHDGSGGPGADPRREPGRPRSARLGHDHLRQPRRRPRGNVHGGRDNERHRVRNRQGHLPGRGRHDRRRRRLRQPVPDLVRLGERRRVCGREDGHLTEQRRPDQHRLVHGRPRHGGSERPDRRPRRRPVLHDALSSGHAGQRLRRGLGRGCDLRSRRAPDRNPLERKLRRLERDVDAGDAHRRRRHERRHERLLPLPLPDLRQRRQPVEPFGSER